MGCLVALSDCSRPGSGSEPMAESLAAINKTIGSGRSASAIRLGQGSTSDRSYREEMATLEILQAACLGNPVIVAIEEIEESSLSTIDMPMFPGPKHRGNQLDDHRHPQIVGPGPIAVSEARSVGA